LDAQTYIDFEAVVVDDGSIDGTLPYLRDRQDRHSWLRVVEAGGAGAIEARRLGVASARGEILAFTDSDCQPQPNWLQAGVKAVDEGAHLVNGVTRPPRPLEPFERSVSSADEGLYPSCNLFVTRQAYEQVGGFDSDAHRRIGFRLGGAKRLGFGEDTIFAWRIRRLGLPVSFVPEAVVEHQIHVPDVGETLWREVLAGAFPALVREVPELRGTGLLRHGLLLGSGRRVPFYSTAVCLIARQRRLAVLATVWWALSRWRDLRRTQLRRQIALIPAEMAMDVVTGSVLVAGSVQCRTPVL
jgi:glycosyltransferase involved in cell wall biosynthesis